MVGAGWQIAAWQSREADGRLFGLCRQELSHRKGCCASESRRRGQPGFLLKEKRGKLIGGNQTGERAARRSGKGRWRCSTGCGGGGGAADGAGEGGEEQEAAGGEGVAPGAGGGHVGEDAGWTTSSANGAGAASRVITSISSRMTRCANYRLV